MNAVWNSYGQLCGCPEIFKKSCKFFCRELDIRVLHFMYLWLPMIINIIIVVLLTQLNVEKANEKLRAEKGIIKK